MATFPSHQSILTYTEAPQTTIRRTPFEDGEAKQTKRFYNLWFQVTAQVLMSANEYDNFLTWFKDDINNGADYFNFPNHKSESGSPTYIEMRLIEGQFNANPIRQYNLSYWIVDLRLEYKR